MDLDATPLRAFLKVAERKSFTRASEDLNVSQPALSASIRELERRIGFSLFERTSRRVALSREGRAFMVNAKRVVLETEWMRQRAREIQTNDLRIAVQHHSILIPERIALTDGFMDAHPQSALQILSFSHARIYEALRNDDADIALVIEPSERTELSPINPNTSSEFDVEVLASKPLCAFVPTGHALWQRDGICLADLAGQEMATINRVHGGAIASAAMRLLTESGARVLRPPEGDAISVMRYAVRHNVLAVDLGWFEVPAALEGRLRRLNLQSADTSTDLVLLRRKREQRPAAELFWNHALVWRSQRDDLQSELRRG